MGYNENNKFAEKWTRDVALAFLNESINILKEDDSMIYIGQLAMAQDTYIELYGYLFDKFPDNDFQTIKKEFYTILQTRLFIKGANNDINATMAIFGLKVNHKWPDKVEQEINQKIDLSHITPLTFVKSDKDK